MPAWQARRYLFSPRLPAAVIQCWRPPFSFGWYVPSNFLPDHKPMRAQMFNVHVMLYRDVAHPPTHISTYVGPVVYCLPFLLLQRYSSFEFMIHNQLLLQPYSRGGSTQQSRPFAFFSLRLKISRVLLGLSSEIVEESWAIHLYS